MHAHGNICKKLNSEVMKNRQERLYRKLYVGSINYKLNMCA